MKICRVGREQHPRDDEGRAETAAQGQGYPGRFRPEEDLTATAEDIQELTQGETPQVLWLRSDNEPEHDVDATVSPAKQEDYSAFAWPSKSSAQRLRSPANTSPANTSPSRSPSPAYRGDEQHGFFRTDGPRRRNSRAKSPRTLYVGDHPWSPYPASPVKLKGWR
ncbi:unnamed protein product [Symbiodinium pilosum]|uniref:Uncharacterized protein n=1 Tax=Symbiodinium pilosum TaxID=2952 RepID=A0A812LP95_SYMPI|nr:unnamed protein product [Symbiodinium pilosum]